MEATIGAAVADYSCTGAADRRCDVARRLSAVVHRLLRYSLAGVAALAVHLATLSALVEFSAVDETVASGIGFLCAVPVNFWLQRNFVFRSKGAYLAQFGRYGVVTATTLLLNVAVFAALVELIGIHYAAAQIISTAIILAANFVLNQNVAFAPRPVDRERP